MSKVTLLAAVACANTKWVGILYTIESKNMVAQPQVAQPQRKCKAYSETKRTNESAQLPASLPLGPSLRASLAWLRVRAARGAGSGDGGELPRGRVP